MSMIEEEDELDYDSFVNRYDSLVESSHAEAKSPLLDENEEVEIEFADVDNIAKPGLHEIDLDNVILTEDQKSSLIK